MYAVIQTGGKQYRVAAGDILQVEKLNGQVGASVTFDQVLFLSEPTEKTSKVLVGKPAVKNAVVQGEIVRQGRGKKIEIFRYLRRKNSKKRQGHRQEYTQVLITGLDSGSGSKVELSAGDKKEKLGKFQSHLRTKGAKPKVKEKSLNPVKAAPVKKEASSTATKKTTKKASKKKAAKKVTKKA